MGSSTPNSFAPKTYNPPVPSNTFRHSSALLDKDMPLSSMHVSLVDVLGPSHFVRRKIIAMIKKLLVASSDLLEPGCFL